MQPNKTYNIADNTGIINSSLCILHCIATPLLISMGAYFLESPIFTYLFIAIALVSIIIAVNKTESLKIKTALWIGFAGFSTSLLFEDSWSGFEYTGYLFSVFIIITHLVNIKYCNECNSIKN